MAIGRRVEKCLIFRDFLCVKELLPNVTPTILPFSWVAGKCDSGFLEDYGTFSREFFPRGLAAPGFGTCSPCDG
jgi:hypothetical protein